MNTLCRYIYINDNTDRIRTQAILYHIYHLALHNKWFEARDLMLMSHLQDSVGHADVPTQVRLVDVIAKSQCLCCLLTYTCSCQDWFLWRATERVRAAVAWDEDLTDFNLSLGHEWLRRYLFWMNLYGNSMHELCRNITSWKMCIKPEQYIIGGLDDGDAIFVFLIADML